MSDLIERLATHATVGTAPRAELAWLAEHGTLRTLAEGDVLTAKGGPVEGMFLVLSGRLAIYVDKGGARQKLLEWRAGEVTGVLPYSRLVSPPGNSVAEEPSEILAIPRADMPGLIANCHEITSILVHKMLDRSRVFTTASLHDEKMVSLGKLSAGLAHELNNPAAAIERGAALLDDRLQDAEHATRALAASGLTDEQFRAIDGIRSSCITSRKPGVLSPLQQAQREDEIEDWLSDHDVQTSITGALADTAVTIEALDRVAEAIPGPPLCSALRWAAATCSVRTIASDVQEAASRIAGLVAAIKGFTHMDQAAVAEPVDLASSLGNTVVVLNAKARSRRATVTVDVPRDLPKARGFVGELNQIWANLIDNALDAIPDGGRVGVSAAVERAQLIVRVVDDGPGIPPERQARIFDPFFTTKPVGKGTGLGLDIVRRLIAHNDAAIELESVPGRTEFRVLLLPATPIAPETRA